MNLFYRTHILFALGLLIVGTMLSGCSPSATLYGTRPPEVPLSGVHTVRLDAPVGQYARAAQPCFFEEFLKSGRFEMTSAPDADAVLRLSMDGSVYDRTHWDDVTWRRKYTRKVERTLPDGRKETVKETVTEPVHRNVRRVEREINMDGVLTAYGRDGRVMASASVSKREQQSYGGRQGWQEWGEHKNPNKYDFDVPPVWEKGNEMACEAGRELARKVTPQSYTMDVPLEEGGDMDGGLVKQGAKLASDGQWEQAASLWRRVLEQNPSSVSALYNLGVFNEAKGTEQGLREARILYKRALQAGPSQNASNGLSRVDRRLDYQRVLREQRGE